MQESVHQPPIAYCRICGRQLVAEEQRHAFGSVYCADHLPAGAAAEPAGSPWTAQNGGYGVPPVGGTSPGLAFILGLIPGVGAIYNGQYAKGLVHVVIFGLLISLASADLDDLQPLFGILLPTWVIYMAFEAFHTAKRRAQGQVVDEFSSLMPAGAGSGGPAIGPIVLIAVGTIFLMNNLGILRIGQILRFWPLLLIGIGAYRLYARTQQPAVPPTAPPPSGREEVPYE